MRQIANAMCDFAEKKVQRKDFQKILFEGLQEKDFKKKNEWDPSRRQAGAGMQNAETAFGKHAAFLRKIKDASAEIEGFQKEIQQITSQDTQWNQKIENCHKKTKNLEAEKRGLETAEKENAPALENLQTQLKEQEDLLFQAEETRKKLAQEIDQVQINETEDETLQTKIKALEDEKEAIH